MRYAVAVWVLLAAVAALAVSGRCAHTSQPAPMQPDEKLAWQKAEQDDLPSGYLRFLEDHPSSRFAPDACAGLVRGLDALDRDEPLQEWVESDYRAPGGRRLYLQLTRAGKDVTGPWLQQRVAGIPGLRTVLLPEVLAGLDHPSATVRRRCVGLLWQLDELWWLDSLPPELTAALTQDAVPRLAGLLDSPDPKVGFAAAEALGAIGDARAVEPLLAALNARELDLDSAGPWVPATARAVAAIRHADAVEPLLGVVKGMEPGNPALRPIAESLAQTPRQQIAEALACIGPPAVDPLLAALEDEHHAARQTAAIALGLLKAHRAVEPLLAAIDDPSPQVAGSAARALGQIGDPRALEPLAAALKGGRLGWPAARALGLLGNRRAVEPLIGAVRQNHAGTRQAAVWALGQIGDPRAVEPLIKALGDPETEVQIEAVTALGLVGDPRAVEPLLETVAGMPTALFGHIGRTTVLEALGRFRDPRAVEPLIDALKNSFFDRDTAVDALGGVGAPAVEPLVAILDQVDGPEREMVIEALGLTRDPRAVEPLAGLLDDVSVPDNAASALAHIGQPALQPLVESLKAAEEGTREAAAKALGILGDPRAVEPLVAVLESDAAAEARAAAARALGRIKDPRAVPPLLNTLRRDRGWGVPEAAIDALAGIQDPRAVEPLAALLEDENPDLESTAEETTRQLPANFAEFLKSLEARAPAGQPPEPASSAGQVSVDELPADLFADLGNRPHDLKFPAVEALARLGDPRALVPLAERITTDGFDASHLDALLALGWRPKTDRDVLHLLLKRDRPELLPAFWPATRQTLLEDLGSDCRETAQRAARVLLDLAETDTFDPLVAYLREQGTPQLALDYADSTHEELRLAAAAWAKQHGSNNLNQLRRRTQGNP